MKLFNWINPLWIMDNFLTTHFDPVTATAAATTAAELAPAIVGGGMTGAGMMTAAAPVVPGLLTSSTPGLMSGLGSLGGAAFGAAKANPFQTAGLGMGIYDRMNQSQAPLQAQQANVNRQQQPMPVPQFNSMLQLPRRPIYIG